MKYSINQAHYKSLWEEKGEIGLNEHFKN